MCGTILSGNLGAVSEKRRVFVTIRFTNSLFIRTHLVQKPEHLFARRELQAGSSPCREVQSDPQKCVDTIRTGTYSADCRLCRYYHMLTIVFLVRSFLVFLETDVLKQGIWQMDDIIHFYRTTLSSHCMRYNIYIYLGIRRQDHVIYSTSFGWTTHHQQSPWIIYISLPKRFLHITLVSWNW
jgi:hypothetical protein